MFQITDGEAMLLMQRAEDRAHAAGQIDIANAHIRRVNSALANARAEIDDLRAELAREKAKRHAAEARLRRH